MGNPIRCTWGRYLRGPLETGPWRHSARWCCKQSSKIICKWSESFDCLHSYQLCTINFLSENCCNQTNRPPIPRARRRVRTLSRPPTNGGEIYGGEGGYKETAYVLQVIFQTDEPSFYPAVPTGDTGRTYPPTSAGGAPAAQAPTETAAPESATPMDIGSSNLFSNLTQPT